MFAAVYTGRARERNQHTRFITAQPATGAQIYRVVTRALPVLENRVCFVKQKYKSSAETRKGCTLKLASAVSTKVYLPVWMCVHVCCVYVCVWINR